MGYANLIASDANYSGFDCTPSDYIYELESNLHVIWFYTPIMHITSLFERFAVRIDVSLFHDIKFNTRLFYMHSLIHQGLDHREVLTLVLSHVSTCCTLKMNEVVYLVD